MTEARFIAKNEENWKALESFNRRLVGARSGIRSLTQVDVREFARLFRLTSYHLAFARTHFPNGQALPYLNRLVGVAHNYFYVRETSGLSDIKRYFLYVFPQAVRETWHYIAVATALFTLGLFFAGFYIALDPVRVFDILPVFFVYEVGGSSGYVVWDYALMSAVIMTNNIAVAINAFVLGIFAGIGTIYVLIYNGLIVGGLFGYLHQSGGNMMIYYSLVLPHGVIELAAIFLSGACGLMIGRGVLMPGMYTRKQSLIINAKKAAVLIPGIVVMLIIGGLIEGFFTPLPISPELKLLFAALTGIGLAAYWLIQKKPEELITAKGSYYA